MVFVKGEGAAGGREGEGVDGGVREASGVQVCQQRSRTWQLGFKKKNLSQIGKPMFATTYPCGWRYLSAEEAFLLPYYWQR